VVTRNAFDGREQKERERASVAADNPRQDHSVKVRARVSQTGMHPQRRHRFDDRG
jgi:hypothetical protein